MKRLTYLIALSVLFIVPFTACRQNTPFSPASNNENDSNIPEQLDFTSQDITVTDSKNKKTLTMGTGKEATSDFDAGADIETPPFTPSGAFYAHFKNKKYKLLKDIRQQGSNKLIWTLEYSPQGEGSVEINWETISDKLNGTLTLVDNPNDPKISVNMSENTSFSPEKGKGGTLYILYNAYGS